MFASVSLLLMTDYLTVFHCLFPSNMCLYTGSPPPLLEPLGVFSIRCQRQSKSGKRAGRTSEEHPAACSSAISAWESAYKKHLLHFVLSTMLWKINTVMVFLPLFSLSSCRSLRVSICVHANAGVPSLVVCLGNKNTQLNKYHYGLASSAEVSFSRTRCFWTKS